jgi:hypothetical protein
MDGSRVTIVSGHVDDEFSTLNEALHGGAFTDADLWFSDERQEFALTVQIPDYDQSIRIKTRWKLRGTLQVPVYEHHLAISGVESMELADESETYEHRIDLLTYDRVTKTLVFEATPPFTIRLHVADISHFKVVRNSTAVETRLIKTIGPIEYD